MQRYTSRRMSPLRLTLIYMLMVCIILTVVTVLTFFVSGYRFDFMTNRIVQGGLVQLESNPSSSLASVDGKQLGGNTPIHKTLASGSHNFTMEKAGYETWQNTVDVIPGSVVWLNYARLIPKSLVPHATNDFPAVESAKASPNRKYIALTEPNKPQITLLDISQQTVKSTTIFLPQKLLSTAPSKKSVSKFVITSWSNNSRFMLVKHTYGSGQTEWLRVDTKNGDNAVRNITIELALPFSDLEFRPTQSSQFYALTSGGDLRRVDLSSDTISAPLENDVAEFTIGDDGTITYATKSDVKTRVRTVGYVSDGATHAQTLRSYTDDGKKSLHAATGVYYSTRYIAISYGKTLDIIEAHLPNSNNDSGASTLQRVRTFALPASGAKHLSIRTHGRFVVAQSGADVAVYDIELDHYTTMKFGSDRSLKWIDGYIAWTDAHDKLAVTDFDGTNQHNIMPVISGLDATLTPNGKYLYGFSKNSDSQRGAVTLSRVLMQLN